MRLRLLVSRVLISDVDDTVLAFVVFNHMESRRRCVADYARSNSIFKRFVQGWSVVPGLVLYVLPGVAKRDLYFHRIGLQQRCPP